MVPENINASNLFFILEFWILVYHFILMEFGGKDYLVMSWIIELFSVGNEFYFF